MNISLDIRQNGLFSPFFFPTRKKEKEVAKLFFYMTDNFKLLVDIYYITFHLSYLFRDTLYIYRQKHLWIDRLMVWTYVQCTLENCKLSILEIFALFWLLFSWSQCAIHIQEWRLIKKKKGFLDYRYQTKYANIVLVHNVEDISNRNIKIQYQMPRHFVKSQKSVFFFKFNGLNQSK